MADLVAVVVVVAGLAGGHLMLRRARFLDPTSAPVHTTAVSVVIPARDEERSLPTVLGALGRAAPPADEVLVVDDGSEDATAAVAAQHGARVVGPGAPPPGWTGKAWACQRGAEEASGDLLVFLDADTVLEHPGALGGLIDLHRQHGGLVSVQPHHHTESAHEQLSAHFNVVAVLASGAFADRPPRQPMAFGPCLVTSRVDLLRVGGHGAVRASVLDDVSLARAYAAHGLPVHCRLGGPAITMRSYPDGVGQLVAGWTKNVAAGAAATAALPVVAVVAWVCAHHVVALHLLTSVSGTFGGRTGWLALGAWAVAWLAAAGQFRHLLRQVGDFRWWTWALFPLPLLAFDLVFLRSAVATAVRRSVRWRGRDVDLRQRSQEVG